MKAIAIGGTCDHVHLLLSLPSTIAIAKAVQLIKAHSSKWLNGQEGIKSFAWQESYGAFTIGGSQVNDTVRYIQNQREHHAKRDFDAELKMILERLGSSL